MAVMYKKNNIGWYKKIICLALCALPNVVWAGNENSFIEYLKGDNKPEPTYQQLFEHVVARVKAEYIEELSDKELIEKAMAGMLRALDPHSDYYNEKEFSGMHEALKGEFGGLGMEVTMEHGVVKVISPYEDGPAFAAGIKTGDYIIAIEGQSIRGLSLAEAVEKLRGKPKSKVKITVFREENSEQLDLNLTREIVKIIPVKSRLIDNSVALIKIASFANEKTAELVKKEWQKLIEQATNKELEGLVLDLRWNPGGLLEQAQEVVELFLENGVIVSTKGRLPNTNQVYRAKGKDITEGLPIVVLVNAGSASASEIVAAALQENKRAIVVGTKTFGKGSVQMVSSVPMTNGAMKLTTSRYYTPLGNAIQARGVEPDVEVEPGKVTTINQPKILDEASLNGHLQQEQNNNAKNKILGKKSQEDDFQLLRAVDLVKGMSLYSNRLSN